MTVAYTPALLAVLPEAARRLRERREALGRRSLSKHRPAWQNLMAYSRYVHGYAPAPHHRLWAKAVMALPPGGRLLIIAPPESGKTQWLGVELPAWLIGRDPSLHIGYACSSDPQALLRSVAVRDTIGLSEKYRRVFPDLMPDKAKGWEKRQWFVRRDDPGDKDPTFSAAGAHGKWVGQRLHGMVLDDVVDPENSATEAQRARLEGWLVDVALPRLGETGWAVAVGTRWNHADLYAYMIRQGWQVIHLPALSDGEDDPLGREIGEPLWPEMQSRQFLEGLREAEPLSFERVYQGRPTPREGAMVKESWWGEYVEVPPLERAIQIWDTAEEDQAGRSWSVCATWGRGRAGYYVLDVWRGRVEYPELRKMALALADGHHIGGETVRPSLILVEAKSSGKALYQDLSRSTRLPLKAVTPRKDKVTRLEEVLDHIAAGRCHLPDRAPWLAEFVREHAEFPFGAHADQVDTTSMALADLVSGRPLESRASRVGAIPKTGERGPLAARGQRGMPGPASGREPQPEARRPGAVLIPRPRR